MPDIKVTHPEHGELTVPAPEGWVGPEDLASDYITTAASETRVREAKRSATNGLLSREDAVGDEALRKAMAEAHGDWFTETLGIKPAESVDVDKIRAGIVEQEVTPLTEKLDRRDDRISKLLRKSRDGDIGAAMVETGLKAQYHPLALALAQQRHAFSEEHDGWFVMVEGSDPAKPEFEVASKMRDGKDKTVPYQDPLDFFIALKASGTYPDWFDPKSRTGSGYKGAGDGGDTGDMTLEAFLKLSGQKQAELFNTDPETWHRMQKERAEAAEATYAKAGAVT